MCSNVFQHIHKKPLRVTIFPTFYTKIAKKFPGAFGARTLAYPTGGGGGGPAQKPVTHSEKKTTQSPPGRTGVKKRYAPAPQGKIS